MSTKQRNYSDAVAKIPTNWGEYELEPECDDVDNSFDEAFKKMETRMSSIEKEHETINAEIYKLGCESYAELLVYIAEECKAKGDDLDRLRKVIGALSKYTKQKKVVKILASSTRDGKLIEGCSLPKIGIFKAEIQINANCSYGQCQNICAFLKDGEIKIGLHMCSIHLQSECGLELPHIAKAAKAEISSAKVQYLYTGLDDRAQVLNPRIIICDSEEEANIKAKRIAKCENCSGNAYTTNKKEGVPSTVVVCGRLCKKCTIEHVKASPCPKCEESTFGRIFTRQCIDHTFLASACKGHGGCDEKPQFSV
jgi:hypothetical protein